MKPAWTLVAALLAMAMAGPVPSTMANEHSLPPGIAWQQGDVTAAFAQAKAKKKPLFLYWGAGWCPPCNQVKATIFNQAAFIGRTRQFIPVYLDGDRPNAQKLAAKFKVRGYPTMILFTADGIEITRLPGEVEAERYLRVLTLALAAARPVKATQEAALRGDRLSADEWLLLADYAWDTDEAQLVAKDQLASSLQRLARSAPPDLVEVATRLALKALAAASGDKSATIDKPAGLVFLEKLLGDAAGARANFDVLVNWASDLTELLSEAKSPQRQSLVRQWNIALPRLADDASLSTTDRLTALLSLVQIAKLDAGSEALSAETLTTVREHVARANRATTDGYERHAVISTAAEALSAADLLDESDALLQRELKRSRSPYFLMLQLAANARQRDDKPRALDWYQKAYDSAEGPATRLQWGVTYINAIVELTPQDLARIDMAASHLLAETGKMKNAFYERNLRSLEKLVAKLSAWNKDPQRGASVTSVLAQIHGLCEKLPKKDPQRANCEALLKPAAGSAL